MDNKMEVDSVDNATGPFPEEIWLNLMGFLNDTTLLNMTHVCKRFKAIAKEVFAKKHNGDDEYYELNIYSANRIEQQNQYRPFFTMFGEDMIAIQIEFHERSRISNGHWVIDLIQRYCTKLEVVQICGTDSEVDLSEILPRRTLTQLFLNNLSTSNYAWTQYNYPKLIDFDASGLNMDPVSIGRFIDNNRQLQSLDLEWNLITMDILQSFSGKLNELKKLSIPAGLADFSEVVTAIKLENLETFEINIDDETGALLLRSVAKGCKNIEKLDITNWTNWSRDKIDAKCEFRKLKSLSLNASTLTVKHIEQLIQKLPNLSSFLLSSATIDEIYNNLLDIVLVCSKLKVLEIGFCDVTKRTNILALNFDLLIRIAEITERNRDMKITLRSYGESEKFVAIDGFVRCKDSIIYWVGSLSLLNLDDKCMTKIISNLDLNAQSALYNTCTRTQKAVKDYVSNTVFHVLDSFQTIDEYAFQCLAPYIGRMVVGHKIEPSFEQWMQINQYCTNLIELQIASAQQRDIYQMNYLWPNLRKLTCLVFRKYTLYYLK